LIVRQLGAHEKSFVNVQVTTGSAGMVCVSGSVPTQDELTTLKAQIADALFSNASAGVSIDVEIRKQRAGVD
jgi:hypothetical protein